MHTERVQSTQSCDSCPEFSDGTKITATQKVHLWAVIREEPTSPTRRVLEKMVENAIPLSISVRHVNRLRTQWNLCGVKGRPRGVKSGNDSASGSPGAVVKLRPHLSFVGIHLFAAWVESQDMLGQVVTLLQHGIHAYADGHPDADFPLLHHKEETLLQRFQALLYGPLFGIGPLTEFDVKEHPLDTLIGRSYQSSTLNQFLGQLERIDAGDALLPALVLTGAVKAEALTEKRCAMEVLKAEVVEAEVVEAEIVKAEVVKAETVEAETVEAEIVKAETVEAEIVKAETVEAEIVEAEVEVIHPAEVCYVDGHMSPFWTKKSMHKGKITMLGRIMAGSQAVITHDQDGHGVFIAYYPPDIRMPRMIVMYCQQVVTVTGIEIFVIDREVNSVALARCFENNGLGLLSMLDKNEYDGLKSWNVTRIGTLSDTAHARATVYEGEWAAPREDDPRHFVLVDTSERVLAYWGTSKVKATLDALQWPSIYRQRTEIQENSFKRMKSHGALEVNYGIKKIVGPDRHQQRAIEKLEAAKDKVELKVAKKEAGLTLQEAKVVESQDKGHTTRLTQRQRRLAELQKALSTVKEKWTKIVDQLAALGTPKKRADRDYRKQKIMGIRTLLLENALVSFLTFLCGFLNENISQECLLKLLFERSGACLETSSEMIYWVNTAGLSLSYRETLGKIVEGICAMNLTCRGKFIRLCLREAPT